MTQSTNRLLLFLDQIYDSVINSLKSAKGISIT